jgi:CheY-like chemotaxis protein
VTQPPSTVLIANSNEDTVEMLRVHLENAGLATVACHVPDIKRGKLDFQQFLHQHRPEVAVWDISPPYEENWTFWNLLRTTDVARGLPFVLTTTNEARLKQVCGDCEVIEIMGKPYDLDEVVKAVQQALRKKS